MLTHNEILGIAIVAVILFCFAFWWWYMRPETPVDPWEGSDGFHVVKLRDYLDYIADEISSLRDGNHEIFSRFNPQMRCAELYSNKEGVLARVFAYTENFSEEITEVVVFTFLEGEEREAFNLLEKHFKVVIDFLPLQQEMK